MPKSRKSSNDAAAKAAPKLDTPASLLGEAAAEIERLTTRCAQLEKIAELFGPLDDLAVVLNAAKASTFLSELDDAEDASSIILDLKKKVLDGAALLGEAMVEIERISKDRKDVSGDAQEIAAELEATRQERNTLKAQLSEVTIERDDLKVREIDDDDLCTEAAAKSRDIIASKCEATLVDAVVNEVMLEVDNPLREVWDRLSPFDQARIRSKVADGVFASIDAIDPDELAP